MKKIIFTLLISLCLLPNVKADCVNLFEHQTVSYYTSVSGVETYYYPTVDGTNRYNPKITKGQTYTFFAKYNDVLVDKLLISNTFNIIVNMKSYSYSSVGSSITFTASYNSLYFHFKTSASNPDITPYDEWEYWLVEGSEVCTPSVEEPEEPDVPVEPEEPDVADTTLNDFYSIFTSKLQSLTQYATENKFILGAISIIILFVILEIVIHLSKGGYH